jgi:hypothetical protein
LGEACRSLHPKGCIHYNRPETGHYVLTVLHKPSSLTSRDVDNYVPVLGP